MPVVIYGVEMSPPVRSVLLTAKAIGLEVQLKQVNMLNQEHRSEAFLKKNPAHTVPVMDDDGFYLFESRAIMVYLVEQYGKDDKLYPKDLKKRALVDNMMYFDASTLAPSIIAFVIPQLFQGKPANPENEAAMIEKISIVNVILGQRPYFAGDHVTLADFSLINDMTMLEVSLNYKFEKFPAIKNWMTKIKQELTYYDDVTKQGLEQMKAFAQSKPRLLNLHS